jgi:hypothetical protein
MAGYLDTYGVADQRRERIVKWSLIIGISTLLLLIIGYYTFRTHTQERVMAQFIDDLQHQQYMEAYKLWGCPQNCRLYPADEFLKDWGPGSKMAKASDFKIQHVDYCGDGVVFDLSYPNTDDIGLWVNRSTNIISFYAEDTPRCPGPHMQLGAFLKSLFS